jgi:hypothetical protein
MVHLVICANINHRHRKPCLLPAAGSLARPARAGQLAGA